MKMFILMMGLFLFSGITQANGKIIRASEAWPHLMREKLSDIIIEFRQGDELPITFESEGDLFETKQASVNYVGVKKNFWLRVENNSIEISFDNKTFKKINEALSGSLALGTGSGQDGGVAETLNIVFKAFIK